MSWTKRPQGGTAPPPGQDRQSYMTTQSQPFNQENMYPSGAGNIQAQQYWQVPPQQHQAPQYSQQYSQPYQQQDYPANANQFYQQQGYNNMNYSNQTFSNTQQAGYQQQNFYPNQGMQNQGQQQNFTQTKPKADGWDDNWDWGWGEDKQVHKNTQPANTIQQPLPQQHQEYNNANIIEQSFNTVDSNCWNWAMDDKKDTNEPGTVPSSREPPVSNAIVENTTVPEPTAPKTASNMSNQQAEEVTTLNDREVVKDRLSNLALGKRFHLENLTPQWSIESQMSQESSDGIQTQSEETYRSENHSRNSNKSSSGQNSDHHLYPQTGLDEGLIQNSEWARPTDDLTSSDNKNNSRRSSRDELTSSMKEMSLSNYQDLQQPSTNNIDHDFSSTNNQELAHVLQPAPSISPAMLPLPVSSSNPLQSTQAMPPPPAISSVPLPPSSSIGLSAQPSSSSIPPPNFPPPTSSSNPFKHAGPFSHKSLGIGSTSSPPAQSYPQPQISNSNLTSPAVVNKVSQHNRVPVGFEANLETTPDNSERPDQPQVLGFRTLPVSQQMPDNMEVAPRNDRNEYLQTAHLSSGDFGENTDFSRGVPPVGLRRMVVGQQESEYNQNLNISGDEPPPGLARMVPGQHTEIDSGYNPPGDNYLDRHIDGQTTENSVRPYRQADGQQTLDNYNQPPPSRANERRPIGLDRLVPGEPSNVEYSQYPTSNYSGNNEQRVVTGVDHDFSITSDSVPTAVREQNMDGSEYTEQSLRNPSRNIIGVRESNDDTSPDFNALPEEQQREITVGQNLQDLSIISSGDLTYSRENVLDGADVTITEGNDRKTDLSDCIDHQASSSRRQSLNRVNTSGEDSERDRAFKSSPRREKHKSSRDRDRDRDRNKDGRYSRGDRKYDPERRSTRDDRRSEKDRRDRDAYRDRRDRDQSPDARRQRRSTRSHRYEAEDTDYYSDRERDRRRHRESSYTSSKPPRPDDKDRRYDERDRNKRYNTIERDRRTDEERETRRRGDRYREREHYERSYRDIDPSRKHGALRRGRDKDDPRRVVTFSPEAKTNDSCVKGDFSSPSRPDSRDATVTDEDGAESRRRDRRSRRTAEPYYDEYAGGGAYADAYLAQRQQYQYYEHLRVSNPAAYMVWYKQYMAGLAPHQPAPAYGDEFGSLPYDARQERGSVHSGRSSAAGLKGNETYYGGSRYRHDAASLRDAPSLRTDVSDRDMSLNFTNLEESTVRSERMTPFKYSTAHIKGSLGARDVVVVRPAYPVDGAPPPVTVLALGAALQHLPHAAQLAAWPGPLVRGVTHKLSVLEYCAERARAAGRGPGREGARDPAGYALLWRLLALCLRQNGVVVGSDIAELLMEHAREYELAPNKMQNESGRGSSASGEGREGRETSSSPDQPSVSVSDSINQEPTSAQSAVDEKTALNRLRELLEYGNRQEAIEWAMSCALWGHAWALAAHADRRTRGAVAARFLASLPRTDPVHSLYAALAGAPPPAVTCVADERWADWRPHAAILLANPSAKPEQDKRNLTQLGDSLAARGLAYCAQFCYLAAGVPFAAHPLAPLSPAPAPPAPPRLSLLLADPRGANLQQFATNTALFATEVYEYAISLSQEDFVIPEFQVYKLVLAARLADVGRYERALAYAEAGARAVTRAPRRYAPALVLRLAALAERLRHHEPAPPAPEEPDSAEASPRHQQWLHDVQSVAQMLHAEARGGPLPAQPSPQHAGAAPPAAQPQAQQYQQVQPPVPTYVEGSTDHYQQQQQQYQDQYQQQQQYQDQYQQQQQQQQISELVGGPAEGQQFAQYDEWPRPDEQQAAQQQYADPYWHTEQPYSGYGEAAAPRPAAATLELLHYPHSPVLRRRLRPAAGPPTDPPIDPPTDLDVQIAHSPRQDAIRPSSPECRASPDSSESPTPTSSLSTLRASATPPPPPGRLIGNTVDSWARQPQRRHRSYKPLVFCGTFPIDMPTSLPGTLPAALTGDRHKRELRRTIEQSLDKFETILAQRNAGGGERRRAFSKRAVRTFDIDEPMSAGDPPPEAMCRQTDVRCYMSGPKTFNIDEPVSLT